MARRFRTLLLVPALFFASLAFADAQTSSPCPSAGVSDHGQAVNGKALASPPAIAEVALGGKAVSIHYNSPSMRCRTIMGQLVPYGKVWRTGANPATSFTTETDLMVGTIHVPAGKYTLYTLPAAPGTPWQLILSRETGQWGTVYHEAQDLGRTPMHAAQLPSPQEVMSLSFEKTSGATTEKTSGATTQLHVKWDKTDEWVELKVAH